MTLINVLASMAIGYLLVTLVMCYFVQQHPRRPVVDEPNWGRVIDVNLRAVDGKRLEVWRVESEGPSRGIVLFMHGWGRNRGRMVGRARIFSRWGFTTVMPSARDHGGSSPCRFMNALKFAEDIETVLAWIQEPVILYGHSAGSGGAVVAAARNPGSVRLLFLEGCYARTREALLSLYTWVHPAFGRGFGPAIIMWMNLFYRGGLDRADPCRLAAAIDVPVMLIQGENDRRFPPAFARRLAACFRPGQARLYVAPGAGHSNASTTAAYPAAVKAFLERHADRLNPNGRALGGRVI
jgi:pimeloyl-ACP methyl ester carboxylesterase